MRIIALSKALKQQGDIEIKFLVFGDSLNSSELTIFNPDFKLISAKFKQVVTRTVKDFNPSVVIFDLHPEYIEPEIGKLFSSQQIDSLMNSYGDQIVVIGIRTPDGIVQAIRGSIIRGNQAVDIFAAANSFSRKHYLSYGLCWELINRCKSLGCFCFDFNGVDPGNNMGVP